MVIKEGSRGTRVRSLQSQLHGLGYDPGRIDSQFGPKTAAAVRQFQAAHGLVVDGIVGPKTWAALDVPPKADTSGIAIPDGDSSRARAVQYALGDLGAVESPNGSNTGPAIAHLVEGYASHWRIDGNPHPPWCAMAVSVWVGRALKLGDRGSSMDWSRHPFGHWFGGVSQIAEWAEAGKGLKTTWGRVLPGAIFLMAREGSGSDPSDVTRAGHCGLVVERLDGGLVRTVEGNTANSVASRVRNTADLAGWVKWW